MYCAYLLTCCVARTHLIESRLIAIMIDCNYRLKVSNFTRHTFHFFRNMDSTPYPKPVLTAHPHCKRACVEFKHGPCQSEIIEKLHEHLSCLLSRIIPHWYRYFSSRPSCHLDKNKHYKDMYRLYCVLDMFYD